ncbi:MAG TPA: hypothetical protein VGM38_01980 [Pseudolysinimonas sp.]|jgi:hypothetical protein
MPLTEILLLALVGLVAVGMFVWILRSDAARVRKARAEADARGEPQPKARPSLTLVYLVVGAAFVIVGILTIQIH